LKATFFILLFFEQLILDFLRNFSDFLVFSGRLTCPFQTDNKLFEPGRMFDSSNRNKVKPLATKQQASPLGATSSHKEEVVYYPAAQSSNAKKPTLSTEDEGMLSGLPPEVSQVMAKIRYRWEYMTSQDVVVF
jgi:hypothetical protein